MAIPEVRILPMDSEEEFHGQSREDVQRQFFLKRLLTPGRPPGKYHYHTLGLNSPPGSIVLFQYEGAIIASAVFDRAERFEEPIGSYAGALYFGPTSIRTFKPVGSELIAEIWPEFKGFSRVKWKLDPDKYPEFARTLTEIETPA